MYVVYIFFVYLFSRLETGIPMQSFLGASGWHMQKTISCQYDDINTDLVKHSRKPVWQVLDVSSAINSFTAC